MNYKLEPFDIEKAKAGAKVVSRNGKNWTPVLFEGRDEIYPIVGYLGSEDRVDVWRNDGRCCVDINHRDLMLSVPTFPDPPEGEAWHNPHNLTPEQVGEGYRLLLRSELNRHEPVAFIEVWKSETWVKPTIGFNACNYGNNYRVPALTPFHWDKPKEPVYRPFTFEEAKEHVGRVVKSKNKIVVELIVHARDGGLIVGGFYKSYQDLMDYYTFLDGSPAGILVEN